MSAVCEQCLSICLCLYVDSLETKRLWAISHARFSAVLSDYLIL